MKLTIYHLKNCDSCKKAIKALEAHKGGAYDMTLVDVRADGIGKAELEKMMAQIGHNVLVNTSGRYQGARALGSASYIDEAPRYK